MRRVLILFAREPEAETSKTRLAASLPPDARLAFYQAMLRDIAESARAVACEERILCWSATTQPRRLAAIFDGFTFVPQSEGSLGDRMVRAFSEASERGDALLGIGSDAPLLTPEELDMAFRALATNDLALAPSFDGGFCALGVRKGFVSRLDALFRDVEWSTKTVFEKVLANYRATCGETDTFFLLPMTFDIDTPDDYRLLRALLDGKAIARQRLPSHLFAFFRAHSSGE